MRFTPWLTTLALVAAFALAIPGTTAQSDVGQDSPGNEKVIEDGQYCFDATAEDPSATCVVLYGHIFDLLNRVPINVQFPPDCAEDLARGFTAFPTVEPVYDFNQLTFYSSPGFVEYGAGSCDDPRLHQERGLTSDVEISGTGVPLKGYIYLSADTDEFTMLGLEGDPTGTVNPDIGAMPCVTVYMEVQTKATYGSGDTIASGSVTKTMVSAEQLDGQESPVPSHACPNSEGTMDLGKVTEFEVDMGEAKLDIPRIEAFHVYAEWYQHANGEQKVAQREWNVHTGQDYRTRVVVPLQNPLRVEVVRPQFFDNKIYIHTSFNSPWGSYDVDPGSIGVSLVDGNGQERALEQVLDPILRFSVDHDGHFKPVNATFPWDFRAEGLDPGEYTVRITAQNWQHTATATKEAKIKIAERVQDIQTIDDQGQEIDKIDSSGNRIPEGDLQDSPGVPVAAVVLALVGMALLALRRRR